MPTLVSDRDLTFELLGAMAVRKLDVVKPPSVARVNSMLEALPATYRAALVSRMELVTLPVSRMLYRPKEPPRYAHFLTSGVASVLTLLGDGSSMAVGLLGAEALVEAVHLLGTAPIPTVAVMRVEGSALRMPFAELRQEFFNSDLLRYVVRRQMQEQILTLAQLATCNYFHVVEARLARCLLMLEDRVGTPDICITQEFLAEMIGVHRPTLTLAAGKLHRQKLIQYSRGQLRIMNRPGLELLACECYGAIRELACHRHDLEGCPDAFRSRMHAALEDDRL